MRIMLDPGGQGSEAARLEFQQLSVALLCRAGVCGEGSEAGGERLAVAQLEDCPFHSCDEHQRTQAKTCLWDHPDLRVLWCHTAAREVSRYKSPRYGAGHH